MPHTAKTVVRTRLVPYGREVLDARLTVLVAPPGCGKSVVLGHWLDDLSAHADVFSLDFKPEHDSPARFRTAVAQQAKELLPALQWDSTEEFNPGDLGAFVEAVHDRSTTRPMVIALDSFEALLDASILATVAAAITMLPPSVHFIIASRTAPAIMLSEWRARGEVVDLDAHDLVFTVDEIEQLARARGSAMTAGERGLLAEATAGWPVAVSLGLSGKAGARAVREYIDDVVLAGLPALEREFLEEVGVLTMVTSEAADQVRESTDAHERMTMLERLGRFPPHERENPREVYLPAVLREHLSHRVGARQPQRLAMLRSRAAANAGTIASLSTRELEVLALLATGLTAEGIADELVLSFHTVKAHMRSIYSKLGVSTRVMAVMRATELGLVSA
jgi:LuxR family maltose regulon positive regulatory protein